VAILLSALDSAVDPVEAQAKEAVPGFHKYDTTDPNWVLCLVNELVRSKVAFIFPKKPGDFRFKLPDQDLTIAICGDWGTGLWSSSQIANFMKAQNPDITIHLGDVYYSGSETEVKEKFLKRFPRGTYGAYALNSNHEMYSGGHGYFNLTVKTLGQQASYFAAYNKQWQLIGLDSAYEADKRNKLYGSGYIGAEQLEWFQYQLEQGANAGLKSIVMTHHNPVGIDGTIDQKFLDQVLNAAKYHPFHYWYWGHEHDGAVFRLFNWSIGPVYGRCIGHGGIPYSPEKIGATKSSSVFVEWTEQEKYAEGAGDPRCGLNGFAVLKLPIGAARLTETFYDDSGRLRVSGQYPPAQAADAARVPVAPPPSP
jgi:3',5'-cyclic AMP phosphodiesterase CpdA